MKERGRVLVVDDLPTNRKLLSRLVEASGHEALTAEGGAEALEVLARESVDLVLLDLMMPDLDGMDVLGVLRDQGRLSTLPVVVVTATDERKVRHQALRIGAVDFLTKPVDALELTAKVDALVELGRHRARAVEAASATSRGAALAQVEQAIGGLPLVVFEYAVDARDRSFGHGSLVLGDVHAVVGMSATEFLERQEWLLRLHPEDAERVQGLVAEVLEGGLPHFATRFRLDISGSYGWRFVTASGDADGCFRGVILDVEEEVALETQARHSQKVEAIGQLAGGIAHDFNNLLAVIIANASFARDELQAGTTAREDVDEVIQASKRAAALTRQLLAFSRREVPQPRPTDLNEAIELLRRILQKTLTETIELDIALAERPAVVLIDPGRFDQVLVNLAVNARDAMPDGGRFSLRVETDPPGGSDARVRVIASDEGHGMDAETLAHAFDPFFTTKGRGTGLGLPTCAAVVHAAHGSIDAESEPGGGTTIRLEFPATEQSVQRPGIEPIDGCSQGAEVLLAEDDRTLARVCARVLQAGGFRVHQASSGDEAIRLIDRLGERLHAVLSDVVMPGPSGFEVAAHVERVLPDVPVLMTSGYMDGSVERHGQEHREILWKPVDPDALVRAVRRAIAGSSPSRSRKVLIVEDDERMRAALHRLVSTAGLDPVEAPGVEAARAVLARGEPLEAVICDLGLSDGSGAQLLEELAAHLPSLAARTVILTGGPLTDAGRELVTSGTFRVLEKPASGAELLAAIGVPSVPPEGSRSPRVVEPPDIPEPGAARRERVFVVDDEAAVAEALARTLKRNDIEAELATSLSEARRRLATTRFDAVVADVGLGDGSGLGLLESMVGSLDHVPVVLVSGQSSVEVAAEAVRLRAADFLLKPIDEQALVSSVRRAIEAGRAARIRAKLFASHFGGDRLLADLPGTRRRFEQALDELEVVYQPIVRAGDGSIFAFEALLRCPQGAFAGPPELLAAAEVLGRVADVGLRVRELVAGRLVEDADRVEAFFVNLHPVELRADIFSAVAEPLRAHARRVVLEVTERASLRTGAHLVGELQRIRELGFRLAVDDLGEDYSGLTSLVSLQPDFAKIDVSLVRGIDRAPLKRDIVSALADLAHRSGIWIVAEGVETAAEAEVLRALGADLLQGFHFGRPAPTLARRRRSR